MDASIVIDVRGLGDKDRPAFSEMLRNGTSFRQKLTSVEKELGAQLSRTLTGAIRDSNGARCRLLLQSSGFVKTRYDQRSTHIVKSFLNISQYIFSLVMPRALDADSKNGPSTTHKAFFLIHLRFPMDDRLHQWQHREAQVFWNAKHVVQLCIWLVRIVYLCLCPREIRYLGFTFRKIFTGKVRNNLAEPPEINTFSREVGSKQFPTGFHASQHRMRVLNFLFL